MENKSSPPRIVPVEVAVERPDGGSDVLTTADDSRIDPAVVATLYVEHGDDLRAFLIGVLRDGELALEALQSTFMRAMQAGHTAREETLRGWLFRVAYNEAMALRRRQKVHDKSVRQVAWSQSKRAELPEDVLARRETVDRVRAALDTLPEEQRQVVRMRIYDEMTFAVIAEELGLPLGTVLTRMRLALKKLQNRLTPDE